MREIQNLLTGDVDEQPVSILDALNQQGGSIVMAVAEALKARAAQPVQQVPAVTAAPAMAPRFQISKPEKPAPAQSQKTVQPLGPAMPQPGGEQ